MDDSQAHFVQSVARSGTDAAAVCDALAGLARPLGFRAALFSAVRTDDPYGAPPLHYFATERDEIVEAYVGRRVYEVDPVLNGSRVAVAPYALHWDDFRGVPLAPRAQQAFEYLDSHWATSSVGFPGIEPSPGIRWSVAFLGDHTRGDMPAVSRLAVERLAIASVAAVLRIAEAAPLAAPEAGGPRLTARETECLTRLAAGDRVDRIAGRLGIAEVTVSLHIRNARAKLGARTSAQAVAAALRAGLLPL
jgi:DNA-binding CsgD family transcriptional regulator